MARRLTPWEGTLTAIVLGPWAPVIATSVALVAANLIHAHLHRHATVAHVHPHETAHHD